mgnify:CR=1 FL=1
MLIKNHPLHTYNRNFIYNHNTFETLVYRYPLYTFLFQPLPRKSGCLFLYILGVNMKKLSLIALLASVGILAACGNANQKAESAVDATKNAAGTAVDATKNAAGAATEATKDAAGAAVDTTKNAAGAAVDATKNAAGAAADATKNATGAAVDATKNAADAAKTTVDKAATDVKEAVRTADGKK